MAADINTQLQNITTDVTAIGNLVNRLVTIFSGGGVQNPDLATMKAEITANLQSNYVPIRGNKTIYNSILHYFVGGEQSTTPYQFHLAKTASTKGIGFRLYNEFIPVTLDDYTEGNSTNQGLIGFYFYGDSDDPLGCFDISAGTGSDGNKYRAIGVRCTNFASTSSLSMFMGIITNNTQGYYCEFPTYTGNYLDSSNKGVTTAFLNNPNNSVIHKGGSEVITGSKKHSGTGVYYKADSGGRATALELFAAPDVVFNSATSYGSSLGWCRINSESLVGKDIDTKYSSSDTIKTINLCNFNAADNRNFLLISAYNNSTKQLENFCQLGFLGENPSYPTYMQNSMAFDIIGHVIARGDIIPYSGGHSLGTSGRLWDQLYASTGTINTSDRNLKAEIENIPDELFTIWGTINFKVYKFKDAIAKKGSDKARKHIGMIAQDIVEAYAARNIDILRYGFVGYDDVDAVYKEEEVVVTPAVYEDREIVDVAEVYNEYLDENNVIVREKVSDKISHFEKVEVKPAVTEIRKTLIREAQRIYSLRYEELLCFEAAYQRWRLARIEQKLGV